LSSLETVQESLESPCEHVADSRIGVLLVQDKGTKLHQRSNPATMERIPKPHRQRADQPISDQRMVLCIRVTRIRGSWVFNPQGEDDPMRDQRAGALMAMFLWLCSSPCIARSKPIESAAHQQIDAGNQAWIDGMKQGNVGLIIATYTSDAVDCSPEGDCVRGRTAIEDHMKEQMAKLGKAESASVTSEGSVQQGRFVYEWGQAKASFPNGKKVVDQYLTAWREEPDGTWKIFRNLVIPDR
jgi:ketosteroid isomerase-like protein